MKKILLLTPILLLSILLQIGCNPSSTTTNTSNPINIEEFSLSGRDVLVVKVEEKFKESKKSVGSSLDKMFSLTIGSNRFIQYSELENQYGKVLGKSKIKDKKDASPYFTFKSWNASFGLTCTSSFMGKFF